MCKVEGCSRRSHARGMCVTHNRRGEEHVIKPHSYRAKSCAFGGCWRPAKHYGYCQGHNQQKLAGKPLTTIRTRNIGKCSECERRAISRGLCNIHYQRARYRGMGSSRTNAVEADTPMCVSEKRIEREIADGIRCKCGLRKPCNFCTGDTREMITNQRLEVI